MPLTSANVRYWGQSRRCESAAKCPLMTQSGHGAAQHTRGPLASIPLVEEHTPLRDPFALP